MRVLIVFAHPVEGSFCSALRDRVAATLLDHGQEIDVLDLYTEDFQPVLSAGEHLLHRSGPETKPAIADHTLRLRWAEALVFIYPTWWGGQPAILKGWIDRVWIEGVAYTLPNGASRVKPLLRDVRHLLVVTTHGSSKLINALQGESGKRVILRGLRSLCHPLTRARWIACYSMDRATDQQRRRFADKVVAMVGRL
ncbi:MAG: NAD(P)H-dependent oxidoreductase [bacterium]